MSPEAGPPLLAQALDEALQPALPYLKYKRLRMFSVRDPPEPGEEEFEPWMSQTTQMLETWLVSNAEKRALEARHRIKNPLIKAPNASWLKSAFGELGLVCLCPRAGASIMAGAERSP